MSKIILSDFYDVPAFKNVLKSYAISPTETLYLWVRTCVEADYFPEEGTRCEPECKVNYALFINDTLLRARIHIKYYSKLVEAIEVYNILVDEIAEVRDVCPSVSVEYKLKQKFLASIEMTKAGGITKSELELNIVSVKSKLDSKIYLGLAVHTEGELKSTLAMLQHCLKIIEDKEK